MSFTEYTYTDGFAEIMVHQETKTGKYLRVYTYTSDLPGLDWFWDKEEWNYINEGRQIKSRAFKFKTERSLSPSFTNFLIKSQATFERLIAELQAAGFICTEIEEEEFYAKKTYTPRV